MDIMKNRSRERCAAPSGPPILLGYVGSGAADISVVHQGTGMSSPAFGATRPSVRDGALLGTRFWSPPV
jgi:hypothetical protein